MTTQKILQKRVQYHAQRLADPHKRKRFDETHAELSSRLASPFLPQITHIAIRLGLLACWHATVGLDRLAKHESAGWSDVHKAFRYQVLAARIMIYRSSTLAPPANSEPFLLRKHYLVHTLPYANDFSLCAAYTGFHQLPEHHLLCNHLVEAIAVSDPARVSSLACFTAWLYKKGNGSDRTNHKEGDLVIKVGLRTYSNIPESWSSEEDIMAATLKICDYHCQRIWSVSSDLTDFGLAPFDLVPYDVLFMISTRSRLGLGTPAVSHPLLTSEFAQPASDNSPEDELYNFIYEKVAELDFPKEMPS